MKTTHPTIRPLRGFTLVEILVAVSILAFMAGLLASLSGQAANLWTRNESQSQIRERVRTVLEFMANDLRQAVLPIDPTLQNGPQLIVNPDISYNSPNSIFWFAPIATDTSHGDLAAVGYFIRPHGSTYSLCRFFVNPGSSQYKLNEAPADWIDDGVIDAVAPADEANDYAGLLFENVPGLWIRAFDENGDAYTTFPDTRVDHKLPARLEITVAFFDDSSAAKIEGGLTVDAAAGYSSAEAFIDALPPTLKASVGTASISVNFQNRR